jgi:hypothetical protein
MAILGVDRWAGVATSVHAPRDAAQQIRSTR